MPPVQSNYPVPRATGNRRKLLIVIVVMVVATLLLFVAARGKHFRETQQKNTFSNDLFSIGYPDSVKPDSNIPTVVNFQDTKDQKPVFKLSIYVDTDSGITLDRIEQLSTQDISGRTLPDIKTEKTKVDNKSTLIISSPTQVAYYIVGSYHIWKIEFTNLDHSATKSANNIVNTFKIKTQESPES